VRAALTAQPAGAHPLPQTAPSGGSGLVSAFTTLSAQASQAALRFQTAQGDTPGFRPQVVLPAEAHGPDPEPQPGKLPLLRVVGQLGGTYLVTEAPEGMYLVDQHAAHERVLYERVLARLQEQPVERQGFLEPQLLHLPPQDLPVLLAESALLHRFGFEFEPFGDHEVLLRALPAGVRPAGAAQFVSELVQGLRAAEGRTERLATSVACHSAVRAGDVLTLPEMRGLLEDLEACNAPQTCPHGRPTMLHMSAAQLEREFGRRG